MIGYLIRGACKHPYASLAVIACVSGGIGATAGALTLGFNGSFIIGFAGFFSGPVIATLATPQRFFQENDHGSSQPLIQQT